MRADESNFFVIYYIAYRRSIFLHEVSTLYIFAVFGEDMFFSIVPRLMSPNRLEGNVAEFPSFIEPKKKICPEKIQHLLIRPVDKERDIVMPQNVLEELPGAVLSLQKNGSLAEQTGICRLARLCFWQGIPAAR